jgi:hypothetical protein
VKYFGPVALSPDGRLLLANGNYDCTAVIWEVATGRELARLFQIGDAGFLVRYGDGSYFASDDVIGDLKLKNASGWINVPRDYHAVFFRERTLDEVIEAMNAQSPAADTRR